MNGVEVSSTANLRSVTVSSTSQTLSESSVNILPNPANDMAIITYSFDNADTNSRIEIMNSLGQQVTSFNGLSSNGSIQLNVSTLAKGVYYCVVISGDKRIIKKLVVA